MSSRSCVAIRTAIPSALISQNRFMIPRVAPIVEISRGLIRQKKERLACECAGDGDALLLPPGELIYPRPRFWCEAHLTEEPLRSGKNLLSRRTDDFEGEGDVLESGAAREETKILKHVPHLPAELPYVTSRRSFGRKPTRTYLSVGRPLGQVRQS